ncbi:hypothetical protein ACFQNJ_06490 [Hydrogenophaga bisanensis]|uniref:NnrS family protein n=1 Tax=Hydrogenophaga bisanensis TaxID=439611 RepID=A0ABW2R7W7_9BURK
MVSTQRTRRNEPPALPRPALAVVALMAILNLLGAVGGALARLGALPTAALGPTGPDALMAHGALLMAGFFGTLIALERAVALHRGLWVPALAGLGGLSGWLLGAWPVASALWVASAAGLLGLYGWAGWRRAMSLPLAVEASGALALLAANAGFWLGQADLSRLGWSAFLVLTIAGERRELTRMVRLPPGAGAVFVVVWAGVALSVALATWASTLAFGLWWVSMAALALWLLRFDVALRQWQAKGWAGHTAICLSVGYVWLALGAALGLAGQIVAWHLVWLGFVMAMVFGHAPIMMPALAGWRPVHTRWALAPLAVLGLSLVLRVVGTLTADGALMALAGTGHALAFVFFGAVMIRAVRRGMVSRPSSR